MNCVLTQTGDQWFCEQCDQKHEKPLPGQHWKRQCGVVSFEPQPLKKEIVVGSVCHIIENGKATRTKEQALELLDYCISGQCEHYDQFFGCTRTGSGCGRYKHWLGRLTVSGCNLWQHQDK